MCVSPCGCPRKANDQAQGHRRNAKERDQVACHRRSQPPLGWLLSGGWAGALLGFLWGGLVRIFLVHHVTWSVNSVCHLWGRRPYPAHDESRNNLVLGVIAMGEGWHNNHHAFPTSARHGLRWYQVDVSWWVIRLLAWFRLAWDVRLPGKQAQLQGGGA